MKTKNQNVELNLRAVIQDDSKAGFFLKISDFKTGECTHDQLQNSLEDAKEQAEKDYGIPLIGWRPSR